MLVASFSPSPSRSPEAFHFEASLPASACKLLNQLAFYDRLFNSMVKVFFINLLNNSS